MTKQFLMAALLASTSLLSPAFAEQQWGDLKVKFVFKGDKPAKSKIDVTRDQAFCGKHELTDESLVVSDDGGVMNVVVYAYEAERGGIKLPAVHPELADKKQTVELANKDCRFEPHVVILKSGDTLKITNPDEVGHNCNLPFLNNKAINVTVPPGQFHSELLATDEPAPIPCECNIHPWMQAKIVVMGHPYAAKSDEHGELTIKNLPAGEKLAFRIFHEKGKFRDIEIGGNEVNRRSVFELELKPGMNDLGTVDLDKKVFN